MQCAIDFSDWNVYVHNCALIYNNRATNNMYIKFYMSISSDDYVAWFLRSVSASAMLDHNFWIVHQYFSGQYIDCLWLHFDLYYSNYMSVQLNGLIAIMIMFSNSSITEVFEYESNLLYLCSWELQFPCSFTSYTPITRCNFLSVCRMLWKPSAYRVQAILLPPMCWG